jgi:succinyl-diaminopimelate desuccinylase
MLQRLRLLVNRARLIETAVALIGVPSPTGAAREVSDRLAAMLADEDFTVERPAGGHEAAPAVVVRFDTGRPGRTIQFDGHLDTVHLPFVAPGVSGDRITGSGAADMKGGLAAAIEALRVVRASGALTAGLVLLTAHDLHESPWGDGRQLDALIHAGHVGDAVLLPEPLCETLPVVGRGLAVWRVALRRAGPPVHEVRRPAGAPSVIAAGAALIQELARLDEQLSEASRAAHALTVGIDPGPPSVFIGQVHSGEIYNQYPDAFRLEGTRRWLPRTDRHNVERDFRALLERVAAETGTTAECEWVFTRDAFFLDPDHPFVGTFQTTYRAVTRRTLPLGPKLFVDDGNSFWALAGIPAITHGPRAEGAHTVNEWVDIDDLERVALQYAATAVAFCAAR